MNQGVILPEILMVTAATVGCLHTLLGPDHYVPFIAMSHANRWSYRRMLAVTTACGLAHVGSSVVIGILGVGLGTVLMQLEAFESLRGEAAAWLLIGFGLAYATWGLFHGLGQRQQTHPHDIDHCHARDHQLANHSSLQLERDGDPQLANANHKQDLPRWSPWCLFLIFAFGPCEALIPLMMVPAAQSHWWAIAGIVIAFAAATILTMLTVVVLGRCSLHLVRWPDCHRFSHAMAGVVVLICGVAVKLGL